MCLKLESKIAVTLPEEFVDKVCPGYSEIFFSNVDTNHLSVCSSSKILKLLVKLVKSTPGALSLPSL